MVNYQALRDLQDKGESAKEGLKSLQEYSDDISELSKTKELAKFQGVFKDAKIFGTAAACFTVANIGLELAIFALGDKPPTMDELILDAVKALDNKVTGMWNAMNVQFDKVHTHMNDIAAKQEISEELKNFRSLNEQIQLYQEHKGESQYIDDLLDDSYDPADIHKYFGNIAYAVSSDDPSKNPLQAAYNSTRGNAAVICAISTELMRLIFFAPMAYSLTASLRHAYGKRKNLSSPEHINELFQHHIIAISDACAYWLGQCEDPAQVKQNVSLKLDEITAIPKEGEPVLKKGRGWYFQYYEAAQQLCGILQAQWYWCDWLVIISEGGEGHNPEQVVSSSKNWVTKFQASMTKNTTANITVAWTPLDLAAAMTVPLREVTGKFVDWEKENTGKRIRTDWHIDDEGLYQSRVVESDLGQVWESPKVKSKLLQQMQDNIFGYFALNSHNFTAHWTNPNRVYFATFMGQEPALDQDEVRGKLRLPTDHLSSYRNHALWLG